MISFFRIESSNAYNFLSLTYSQFENKLINIDSEKYAFAIGAAIFNKPVGLVFASIDTQTDTGSIETLYVLENHRKQGIGSTLMKMIEKLLEGKECKKLQIKYRKPVNSKESFIEKIIKKSGWEKPLLKNCFFKLKNRQEILNELWMNIPMPPSCQVFYWRDLKEEEIRLLKEEDKKTSEDDEYLSPFMKEDFDPNTSLGLKHNGEIVGWNITRRLSDKVILFALICIKKEFRRGKFAPLLLAESIKKAYKNKFSKAIFTVDYKNKKMLRLSNKHLKKFSYEVREEFESEKYLRKGGELSI